MEHKFTKSDLQNILDNVMNKTLGEVDKNNVFSRTISNPKITGIAGDVIEQSVLEYPADTKQEPDLKVDDIDVELKTLGIRKSKKDEKLYEAKEPLTVTAVSPDKIVSEEFYTSNFWHKIEHLLLVFYLYDSDATVKASDYANFLIKGYEFFEFSKEDQKILENDWKIVRNFIKYLQDEYTDYESEYPRISHELREKLLYIDTAPKWPNRPRFRIKRSVVSNIIQEYFGNHLEKLPDNYSSYADIENKCKELTLKYSGMTIKELLLHLFSSYDFSTGVSKSIGEQLTVKMFGGSSKKISQIELFSKLNILPKTIVVTEEGKRTEDMKLFPLDFEELSDPYVSFEESSFLENFTNMQLMCILFEEHDSNVFESNTFLGFKRFMFSNDFIESTVRGIWNSIRELILNNKLEDVVSYKNGTNIPIVNKNGVIKSAPNFPKSKDSILFVRGGGADSSKKTEEVNGIKMYKQYLWLKGSYITEELSKNDYI